MLWKVKLIFPDGGEVEDLDDPTFDTEHDAYEFGLGMLGEYREGREVLNTSDPIENPIDDLEETMRDTEIYTYEV